MEIINPIVFQPSMLTSSTVSETDYAQWASGGNYTAGTKVISTTSHRKYECLVDHTSIAASSTSVVTITIGSPTKFNLTAHGFLNGAEVILSTTGTLPTGFTAGTKYYVQNKTANDFELSSTWAGVSIVGSGTQAGVHKVIAYSTNPIDDISNDRGKWLDLGATNKFAMFDEKWGTQTTSTSTLTIVLQPNKAIDSIALLNLIGSSVTISSSVGGSVIYTKTISLMSDEGVYDWLSYFIAPIVKEDDIVVTDLFPYYNQEITITITGTGTVAIGNVIMGAFISLGELQLSPTFGIIDYSKREVDEFGNVILTKRNYAKRMNVKFTVDNSFVDQLGGILASVRSTPVVWMGFGSQYSSLIIWGWYKDFEVDIAYHTTSYCTMTIEGLI